MTLEAPFHLQGSGLIRQRHQVNAPMTSRAAYPLVYVNAVIEIDEVGQVVNAGPLDGLTCAPALAYWFKIRAIRPNLRVAVHACFGWRDTRICQLLNSCMAVAAIDPFIAHVMFVAELYRLLAREEGLSIVRGSVELEQHPDADPDKKDRAEDGSLRDEVRASIEDLPHRFPNRQSALETTRSKNEPRIIHTVLTVNLLVWELRGGSNRVSRRPAAPKQTTSCRPALFTIIRSRQCQTANPRIVFASRL